MATQPTILMSVGTLYVPPKVTLKDLDRALALDDGEFKESEHPRDKGGKFTEGGGTGGAGAALTGAEKSYIVNSHVGQLIKAAGFKKAKTGDGLLTFQHPSGAKVIVHPPASGKKSSSKWTHWSPGPEGHMEGEGVALAKVLGVAVKKAEAKKEEPAPNVAESSPEQVYSLAAANGFKYKVSSPKLGPAGENAELENEKYDLTVAKVGNWILKDKAGNVLDVGNGPNNLVLALAQNDKKPTEEAVATQVAAALKPGETVPAALLKHKNADGSVNMKDYMTELGYGSATPPKPGGQVYTWGKPGGAKVELNVATGEWLAATPGFATKQGKGSANLAKLLAGGKAEKTPSGGYTWENAQAASLVQTPGQAAAEAKHAASQAAAQAAGEAAAEKEMSEKKAANKTMKALVEAAPPRTNEESVAIGQYTDGGYNDMNGTLRAGGKLEGRSKVLNDWLMKAEFPEDAVLWRKVDGAYASILKSVLGVGAKFYEKGFSSTSTHGSSWHGSLHLKINVKKGQRGAAVKHASEHPGENEVVLPANTAYVVKGYDPESHEVEVEVDQSHLK